MDKLWKAPAALAPERPGTEPEPGCALVDVRLESAEKSEFSLIINACSCCGKVHNFVDKNRRNRGSVEQSTVLTSGVGILGFAPFSLLVCHAPCFGKLERKAVNAYESRRRLG